MKQPLLPISLAILLAGAAGGVFAPALAGEREVTLDGLQVWNADYWQTTAAPGAQRGQGKGRGHFGQHPAELLSEEWRVENEE